MDVCIEKRTVEDYNKPSRFHHRTKGEKSDGLRIKDCYKFLFNGGLIGVIVYSSSYLDLKPRNIVFGERYVFTP